MKKIYQLIGFCAVGSLLTTSVYAQSEKDTTLNRQVLLEREFNPSLQDASKINTLPAIHEPVIKATSPQFETRQPGITLQNFPVGDTGSGDIKTTIDYSKHKGYLSLAAGNYANLYGAFGIRAVESVKDQLDVFARYNSTNGKVDYAEKHSNGLKKTKAKYSNLLLQAKFQHSFEFLQWHLNGSFENTAFNYYGNSFDWSGGDINLSKQQSVNNFGIETGVKSNANNEFIYEGTLKYNNFSTKYGPRIENDGVGGGIVDAAFDMSSPLNMDQLIGVRLGVTNHTYNSVKFSNNKNQDFHGLTKLKFNPYFGIHGSDYKVDLGANLNYVFDRSNKFAIAPDIHASWEFIEKATLYANAIGGINDNNYLSILQENRYISPERKVAYSHTLINANAGVKLGLVRGVEFDLFGGYKQTNDEHLYIAHTGTDMPWGNVSDAENYFDLGTAHIGGLVKTSLIPYTDLSAKVVSYFYNVGGNKSYKDGSSRVLEAWNLPTFTFNLNADVKPIEPLTLSISYEMQTGRKAEHRDLTIGSTESHKMKNVSELNFRCEHQVFDWLTVNAKVNNILNQKYETYYGYTHQGINALVGASIKF